ncbi:hypothetical protein CC86DRAFT_371613 [Ophiobolus disseminans]|uniref:Extracellular mutant protein 11 C-terminal domain-containing protein n=1 Tax=Ophiobolus disseminans TaxID=1469910 RepID=A0A6A6ZT39_9PLEO|nr:hypothetical protein CC86DRAFT_371613 [Ophiobolus disseminans]
MQRFVKNHGGVDGPPNAQDAQKTSNRQAIAANAKVSTKHRPSSRQSHSAQVPSGIPSRGLGNVQNTSAAIQHAPHRGISGPRQKRDLYDTDGDSIDTTVNQPVVKVEDSQQGHQQPYPQPDQIVDLGSEAKSDEEESDVEEGEDEYDNEYNNEPVFTQQDVDYLTQQNQLHLSRSEAFAYLQQNQPGRFRTIDGDSYPTTTEGDPSEVHRDQEPPSEYYDDEGQVSPSPQRHAINGHRPLTPPSMHRGPMAPAVNRTMNRDYAIFNQSAALRNQQRANNLGQLPANSHQGNAAPLPSSQLPSYSQANREVFQPKSPNPQAHPNHHVAFQQPHQPQVNIPQPPPKRSQGMIHPQVRISVEHPQTARTKEVPIIQPQQVAQPRDEQIPAHPYGDYDLEILHKMHYDQLKNESFDTDPRAPDQPLSDDMLQTPLVERLEHVQKNLEPAKQVEFFHSLPTTEWEDAGDWFLDQFSSIITRTKEARQKKRKLAQGFEDEIEKRHEHVNKKQNQVEDAMNKMKAQGEGLVPRSPRPSESPRRKKT